MKTLLVGKCEFYSSIQAAVTAATPGDIIFVKEGTYNELVTVTVANIKIISECGKAILDGQDTLNTAFQINADNVEIRGFIIENYKLAGIIATRRAARLIENEIRNISSTGQGYGILVLGSGTLVYRNTIDKTFIGVDIRNLINWVIENCISESNTGISIAQVADTGNAIIKNTIKNNSVGIINSDILNLLAYNVVHDNITNGVIMSSHNNVMLSNKILSNNSNGILLNNSDFSYLGDNLVKENCLTGILINELNNYNSLEDNDVFSNEDSGIEVKYNSKFNLIYKNVAKDNSPKDIVVNDTDNTILHNKCEKCKPESCCC